MREIIAKVPESQPYETFDTYRVVRDNGLKVELLTREVTRLRAELQILKNMVSTLINGNQK